MKQKLTKYTLLRYWTYFRRGHSIYLIFAITFLNFLVIQWRLLVEQIDFLEAIFRHFLVFSFLFMVTYIFVATIIGWVDYKRGAVPVDQTVAVKASPWHQDLSRAIILLAEGKNEKVVELMEKWTKRSK